MKMREKNPFWLKRVGAVGLMATGCVKTARAAVELAAFGACSGAENDGHQQGTLPCVLCFHEGRRREARGAGGALARTSCPRQWHRVEAIQLCASRGRIQDRFVEQDDGFPVQIMEDSVEAIRLLPQKGYTRSLRGEKVVFNVPQIMKDIADVMPVCASKKASRPHGGADSRFPRATDLGGKRWRRSSSKVVHVDVDTVSRWWKFIWSRGSLLFSFFLVCSNAKACAHIGSRSMLSLL